MSFQTAVRRTLKRALTEGMVLLAQTLVVLCRRKAIGQQVQHVRSEQPGEAHQALCVRATLWKGDANA